VASYAHTSTSNDFIFSDHSEFLKYYAKIFRRGLEKNVQEVGNISSSDKINYRGTTKGLFLAVDNPGFRTIWIEGA